MMVICGSGKLIKRAIKKYGVESFSKDVLYKVESSEEMFSRERELIEIGNHSYNLNPGGKGGFGYINSNGLNSFSHINSLPIEDRPNVVKIQKMKDEGIITWGRNKALE